MKSSSNSLETENFTGIEEQQRDKIFIAEHSGPKIILGMGRQKTGDGPARLKERADAVGDMMLECYENGTLDKCVFILSGGNTVIRLNGHSCW